MKAVLISIQPKWCELIASGKKTIEVRKTRPKFETPFKCYIYQTKTGYVSKSKENDILVPTTYSKVIGEFVCDMITDEYPDAVDAKKACLTAKEIIDYANGKHSLFLWHISDLVIYDKPKGLNEFYKKCETLPCEGCEHLKWMRVNADEYEYDCDCMERLPITRPPQSWRYVTEI